jgi:hypothetical protein
MGRSSRPRFLHLRPSGRFDYVVDGSGRAAVAGCPFALRPGDVARMRELLARGRGAPQATIAIGDHDSARPARRLPGALL